MDIVFRIALIYLVILVGLRLLGKREFGQLSPLELVTLLLIPEIVAEALMREDSSLTGALVGITTLFSLVFLTSLFSHRSPRLGAVISGVPTVLVRDGRLIEESLNRERVNPEEIMSELRKSGLEALEQVKWAVLEADGKIAIVPADPEQQVAPGRPEEPEFVG